MSTQDWDQTNQRFRTLDVATDLTVERHMLHSGTAPTAVGGTNAGTTPPAPVVSSLATDVAGNITFGSGSGSPAAGIQLSVTFATPFVNAPTVMLIAKNDATQVLGLSVTTTTTGFNVVTHTALGTSQGNTTYSIDYLVHSHA